MFTNNSNIPLSLSVWLAQPDDYDLAGREDVISATSLIRPTRSLILGGRVDKDVEVDIHNKAASAIGTAIHNSIENAWKQNFAKSMIALGYADTLISRVRVNPTTPKDHPDQLDVYLDKRTIKEFEGVKVGGKFDIVIDGELEDVKSTSTYTYVKGSNDKEYRLQGSIYRWLNPEIITSEYMKIAYVFTDWKASQVKINPDYPPYKCMSKRYPLFSLAETEAYIRERLNQIKTYLKAPQDQMPECTPRELWQEPPRWAYYKDPNKTARATKLFDLEQDAHIRNGQDGGRGLVVKRPAEVKRCGYCDAFSICEQAKKLKANGLIK